MANKVFHTFLIKDSQNSEKTYERKLMSSKSLAWVCLHVKNDVISFRTGIARSCRERANRLAFGNAEGGIARGKAWTAFTVLLNCGLLLCPTDLCCSNSADFSLKGACVACHFGGCALRLKQHFITKNKQILMIAVVV